MDKNVFYNKDCSSMEELPENGVDLIVSGPPYWDYIDYTVSAHALYHNKHIGNVHCSYDEFLHDLERWYTECFRVLRPGRYCVVNVGTVRRDGHCYALPFHAVSVFESIGFEFCFEVIWHKVSGGRRTARTG